MYAIYLRKSRKDLDLEAMGEGETLARHKQALTELAKKKGLKISKVYEEMVSGESIADRPQMQMLLDDVITGKYKGVLVMEVERLARGNTKDQGEVAEAFAISKTLIITPMKTYDPNNEFDEEYFEFGLFMSRREYKTIRRRMQRGIIASVNEGNYVGSLPPYGYDIIRLNKKERTLKTNEQSEIVKMIFDWFVNERLSPGEIGRKLTEMGIPTKTGKPEWAKETVRDILQNNLYTGKIRWNRRKVSKEYEDGKLTKKKRRCEKKDYLIVEGKHPAIISEEMFEKAQTLFVGIAPVKLTDSIRNPLAGLLVCKKCNKSMRLQTFNHLKNTKSRYVHTSSQVCKCKSSTYENVMDALIEALKMYIEDFEFKMTNEHLKEKEVKQIKIIESMEKELQNFEKQRKQLFDYLERNLYTEDEFIERKGILNEKMTTLKKSIEEEKSKQTEKIDYEEKIIKFTEIIESLKDENIDAKYKNNLLKEVITRIDFDVIDLGRHKGGIPVLDIYFE